MGNDHLSLKKCVPEHRHNYYLRKKISLKEDFIHMFYFEKFETYWKAERMSTVCPLLDPTGVKLSYICFVSLHATIFPLEPCEGRLQTW